MERGCFYEPAVLMEATTPFELMYELLLQLPESKEAPLWAYVLVVEVFGKRDCRDVKIKLWNRHPSREIHYPTSLDHE